MEINVQGFLDSLPLMGKGMLGVFVVIAAIVATVYILNKATSGKGE